MGHPGKGAARVPDLCRRNIKVSPNEVSPHYGSESSYPALTHAVTAGKSQITQSVCTLMANGCQGPVPVHKTGCGYRPFLANIRPYGDFSRNNILHEAEADAYALLEGGRHSAIAFSSSNTALLDNIQL